MQPALQPTCPKCNDSGYYRVELPVGDPAFGKARPCDCQAERQTARLRSVSGLHGTELTLSLNDIDVGIGQGAEQMVEACRAFVRRPAGILTIWGPPGNAKSTALRAVVNELVQMGAVYVTGFDLFNYVRRAFNRDGAVVNDDAYWRLARFEQVPVLAVDEFDKVRTTDWVVEQLTDLIDKRYRGGQAGELGTLFAMNSDPAEQSEWIASRLRDGRNKIVHNPDLDLRPHLEGGAK